MRQAFALFALLLPLLGCNNSTNPSTAPTTTQTTPAANPTTSPTTNIAGSWTGQATIVVNWVQQRQLPIRLEIAGDGTVGGAVGDAMLTSGKLSDGRGFIQRTMGWGRDFRIHGRLQGTVIKAENVGRDEIDILFDQVDEKTLMGGLHTSGWKGGGKDQMKLSAGDMTLRRLQP